MKMIAFISFFNLARQLKPTVATSNLLITEMKSSTSVLPTTLNSSTITSSKNALADITTSSVVTSRSSILEMTSTIIMHPTTSNSPVTTPANNIEQEMASPTITTSISQKREIMSTTISSKITPVITSSYTEITLMPNEQAKKSGQTDDGKGNLQ